jgi:hypothetical protein
MRKYPSAVHDAASERAKSRPWWIASLFLIVIAVTPLAVECGNLCHAQWSAILGKSRNAPTPILNWIHESLLTVRDDLRYSMLPLWSQIPSSPTTVLILGAVAIVLGIVLLRASAHMST